LGHAHPFRTFAAGARASRPALPRLRWKSGVTLALLCSGVAMASIPSVSTERADDAQWQALGIAPLAKGGLTGMRMAASDAVEAIEFAPERARIDATLTVGDSDSLRALLMRAGASYSDAVAAGDLLPAAPAGTSVAVVLGPKTGSGRMLQQVQFKSGLGERVTLRRDASGGFALARAHAAVDTTPLRIRGRAGDGLYWALRAAGASPQAAAQYLAALATEIDVGGDIGAGDTFDLILSRRRAATGEQQEGALLYAGLDRAAAADLQLVKWTADGRSQWIDAAHVDQPRPVASGMAWPVAGHITSYFGYRRHPILRFSRLHAGVDFGARWGSPIVASADGQVVRAGWAGGYGRQVRIAHPGGLVTSYSHMSQIVAEPGTIVRAGQLIGYVGSSGLSTGPHLHYEVRRGGQPINPLSVRFATVQVVDNGLANAVKARLKALMRVGVKA
jgi:murein DD-endopeptidase MepM/ murein hydrolase activator NlpD